MGSRFEAKQFITGEGKFNAEVLNDFMKVTKLNECSLNYAVVAIMGPQSSGKSTLLNALFGTNFEEMDATKERKQTTNGIWVASCNENIIFDIEGTDGNERGEDDTAFEKQSSAFALAVSDILIINLEWNVVGRVNGANIPLMKTVFQVMVDSFIISRKRTLLFTIRDKSPKASPEVIEKQLTKLIDKIWQGVKFPQAHTSTKQLRDLFQIKVVGLSSYEDKKEKFQEEVDEVKKLFLNSTTTGGLAGDRRDVVPASSFPFSAEELWKTIKQNKQLDLPSHNVLVANFHCEETLNKTLTRFKTDEGLLKLLKEIKEEHILNVGKELSSILEKYLSLYDHETFHVDEHVRNSKRQQLESKALEFVDPDFTEMLRNIYSKSLENFKTMLEISLARGEGFEASARSRSQLCMDNFDKGCKGAEIKDKNWNAPTIREKLQRKIDEHKSSCRQEKLNELVVDYENKLCGEINGPLGKIFKACKNDTWVAIRNLLIQTASRTESAFSSGPIVGYELTGDEKSNILQKLKACTRKFVEERARIEAQKVSKRMGERFLSLYVYTGKEDLKDLKKKALSESLKVLAIMAAIRLEMNESDHNIEDLLSSYFLLQHKNINPLNSCTWDQVSAEATLISPVECDSLWKQFLTIVEPFIERNENLAQIVKRGEVEQKSQNALGVVSGICQMVGQILSSDLMKSKSMTGASVSGGTTLRPKTRSIESSNVLAFTKLVQSAAKAPGLMTQTAQTGSSSGGGGTLRSITRTMDSTKATPIIGLVQSAKASGLMDTMTQRL